MFVIDRPHWGSQLIGHSYPLSHTTGMQQKISGTPQDLFILIVKCPQDSKSSTLTLSICDVILKYRTANSLIFKNKKGKQYF
jgi:hypothetical protein